MSQEPKRARSSGTPLFNQTPAPSTWTYTVRTTPKSTTAYIANTDGSRVRMQLPRMRVPFGVQEPLNAADSKEESKSRPNLELDVSCPDLVAWGDAATAAAVDYIAENSRELMKKAMKKDFVEQLFRAPVQPARNEFNPLLRTKVTKTGTYASKVRIVTDSGSPTSPLRHREGTLAEIGQHDEVVAVVEVSNIWFANNSAGLTLLLTHVLVYKKSNDAEVVFNIPDVSSVEVDDTPPPVAVAPFNAAMSDFGTDEDAVADPFA